MSNRTHANAQVGSSFPRHLLLPGLFLFLGGLVMLSSGWLVSAAAMLADDRIALTDPSLLTLHSSDGGEEEDDGDCHYSDVYECKTGTIPPCTAAAHSGNWYVECHPEEEAQCYSSWVWEDCVIGGDWDEDCYGEGTQRVCQEIRPNVFAFLDGGSGGIYNCGSKNWCGD